MSRPDYSGAGDLLFRSIPDSRRSGQQTANVQMGPFAQAANDLAVSRSNRRFIPEPDIAGSGGDELTEPLADVRN
jgi:hypothetical protein